MIFDRKRGISHNIIVIRSIKRSQLIKVSTDLSKNILAFFRCIVGDFVTEGEGNGKKTSKARAAELMLDKLKELPPLASCQTPPKKKSSTSVSANSANSRKKSKNLIKLEQKASPDYGQSINPISRLIQIQQAKKQKEPVYTLIIERGMPRRREFVMQVSTSFLVFYPTFLVFDRELHSGRGLKNWFVIVVVVRGQLSIFGGFRRYWSLVIDHFSILSNDLI